jgi:hypothetical protein
MVNTQKAPRGIVNPGERGRRSKGLLAVRYLAYPDFAPTRIMLRCAMAKPADAQEDGEAVPPVKWHFDHPRQRDSETGFQKLRLGRRGFRAYIGGVKEMKKRGRKPPV